MRYERNTPRVVLACLFVFLVSWSGFIVAQERANAQPRQRLGWWEKEDVQTKLGLSSEQISAIAAIDAANRDLARECRKNQQKAYRNMIRLLTAGPPSEEEIAERRTALEEASAESIRQNVDHWIKLRDELTREQWEKLPQVAPRVLQIGGSRTLALGTIRVGQKSD